MVLRVARFLNARYSDLWQVRNDTARRQLLNIHSYTGLAVKKSVHESQVGRNRLGMEACEHGV